MAISHELSSEIAAALFAAKERSPHELNDLKEIVFKIHSALEQFSDEDRMARIARVDPHAPQPENRPAGKAQSDVKARSAGKDAELAIRRLPGVYPSTSPSSE